MDGSWFNDGDNKEGKDDGESLEGSLASLVDIVAVSGQCGRSDFPSGVKAQTGHVGKVSVKAGSVSHAFPEHGSLAGSPSAAAKHDASQNFLVGRDLLETVQRHVQIVQTSLAVEGKEIEVGPVERKSLLVRTVRHEDQTTQTKGKGIGRVELKAIRTGTTDTHVLGIIVHLGIQGRRTNKLASDGVSDIPYHVNGLEQSRIAPKDIVLIPRFGIDDSFDKPTRGFTTTSGHTADPPRHNATNRNGPTQRDTKDSIRDLLDTVLLAAGGSNEFPRGLENFFLVDMGCVPVVATVLPVDVSQLTNRHFGEIVAGWCFLLLLLLLVVAADVSAVTNPSHNGRIGVLFLETRHEAFGGVSCSTNIHYKDFPIIRQLDTIFFFFFFGCALLEFLKQSIDSMVGSTKG